MRHSLLLLGLLRAVAFADEHKEQADRLFAQGKDAIATGRIGEGCDLIDQANRLDPTPSTWLHGASCREKNDQYATAWEQYLFAAYKTVNATTDKEQLVHKLAAERAARLEHLVSTIQIDVVGAPHGLELTLGGKAIAPERYGQPMPLDGGTYVLTARAPGSAEWSTTIYLLKSRDVKVVSVPQLRSLAMPTLETEHVEAPSHVPAYVLGGGGVALLGGAVGFALWGNSTIDKANAAREPDRTALWHSANAKRYTAEGLAIGGAAAVGIAVWLYLRAPVAPMVDARGGGVQVVGRW